MNSEPHRAKIDSAEILAIGTELLLGETVDTNGASIAARLAEHGVDVYWSMRVGDNRDRIVAALEAGLARSDLVITSGGLGPTDDDLTRESIAHVAGQVPEVDTELERDLRAYFARSGRTMPERNVKQAWLIPSATALPNPHGTAPGWLVRLNRSGRTCMIAALPGPPREMLPMLEEQLLPRLALPDAHLWSRTFKTGGIGESHVAELLGDLTQASNPSVATYARADGVHVRVAAKAGTKTDAEALGAPVAARVADLLGAAVWDVHQRKL
jgi:Predicted nucleotide-utilizing enzyme related to molybdopterin-biosynthesis enzyme MoeA